MDNTKWEQARQDIDEIVDALPGFASVTKDFGVDRRIATLIAKHLADVHLG